VQLRRRLYPGGSAVRLVHGEADFLPGLIIDQFGDQISLQAVSFGMDMRLQTICDCLQDMLHPMAIIERNDTPLRTMEQLPLRKGVLTGTAGPVMIKENEIDYEVDLLEGQKTGFFLDQRENRRLAGQYSNGLRVLDCFCNDGGFALNAAHGGAETVLGIDSSEGAIQAATRNAQRNGLQQIQFVREDAFEALNRLAGEGRIFDMIILDPPSFSRNRKTVPAARHGYRDLHARAFRVLAPDGFLATACCSHHIDAETFLEDLQAVARKAGKRLQLLQWRGAPSDHPVLPGVPETEYLKFGLFKVSAP
jgi:23S rRNA (cytosine1962-C5)-methyltransferase